MNLEKLKADYPDLHAQVMEAGRAEVQAKMDAALETSKTEAAAAVDAVKAGTLDMVAVVLGDDARTKLDQVMASGMTADQVKIGKELFGSPDASGSGDGNADATTRKKILDGIRDGAPDPAPPAGDDKEGEDFMDKVEAYQAAHNCKRSVAIGAIAASEPDLHESWLKAQQK